MSSLPGVRSKAWLKNQLPDRTTDRVQPIASGVKLLLAALLCSFAGAFLWASSATVVITVTSTGGVVVEDPVPSLILAPVTGIVSLDVTPGHQVSTGDYLGTLLDAAGRKTNLVSTLSGAVLEIEVPSGMFTHQGMTILKIGGHATGRFVGYAYLSKSDARQVKREMAVRLELIDYPAGRYGWISGRVKRVAVNPATPSIIATVIGDQELARAVLGDGSRIQVEIELDDGTGAGGLDWTRGSGPSELPSRVPLDARAEIVIGTYHPIALMTSRLQ